MAESVGDVNLALGVDARGWESGLAKAGEKLEGFIKAHASKLGSMGSLLKPLSGLLAGGVGVGAALSIGQELGGAAVDAAKQFAHAAHESFTAFTEEGREVQEMAKNIGLSTSAMYDLNIMGELELGWSELAMVVNRYNAAAADVSKVPLFRRMGLERTYIEGNNAKDVILDLVGAMDKLPHAERAHMYQELFNLRPQMMMRMGNLLGRSREELEGRLAFGYKYGLNVTESDRAIFEQTENLGDAQQMMKKAAQMNLGRWASTFEPTMMGLDATMHHMAASRLKILATEGTGGAINRMAASFNGAGIGGLIREAYDTYNDFMSPEAQAAASSSAISSKMTGFLQELDEQIEKVGQTPFENKLQNTLTDLKSQRSITREQLQIFETEARSKQNTLETEQKIKALREQQISPTEKIREQMELIEEAARRSGDAQAKNLSIQHLRAQFGYKGTAVEQFDQQLDALQQVAAQTNMTEAQFMRARTQLVQGVLGTAGVDGRGLQRDEKMRTLQDMYKRNELDYKGVTSAQRKVQQEFEQSIGIQATPLEVFQNQISTLHTELSAGRINWTSYSRGIASATAQLEQMTTFLTPQAALLEGSMQAAQAIVQARAAGESSRTDPGARLEAAIRMQLDVQRRQEEYQRRTAQAVEQNRFARASF